MATSTFYYLLRLKNSISLPSGKVDLNIRLLSRESQNNSTIRLPYTIIVNLVGNILHCN